MIDLSLPLSLNARASDSLRLGDQNLIAPRFCGVSPAARCCCGFPLQTGVYAIAILCFVEGVLGLLGVLTFASQPFLLTARKTLASIDTAVLTSVEALYALIWIIIAHFIWQGCRYLNEIALGKAMFLMWTRLGAKVLAIALALLKVASLRASNAMDPGVLNIFVISVIVGAVLLDAAFTSCLNYFIWSLKTRIKLGDQQLVLLGTSLPAPEAVSYTSDFRSGSPPPAPSTRLHAWTGKKTNDFEAGMQTASDPEVVVERFRQHVLVWIDLELTGLNPQEDTIVEIAIILTDMKLGRRKEGPNIVIHTESSALSPWCLEVFSKNGLLEEMKESRTTVEEAEATIISFFKEWIDPEATPHLAGSSVHIDRLFLLRHMPKITDFLHYRIVDVTSIKLVSWAWLPSVMHEEPKHGPVWIAPKAACTEEIGCAEENKCTDDAADNEDPEAHRAMADLRKSIASLEYYKLNIFRQPKFVMPGSKANNKKSSGKKKR